MNMAKRRTKRQIDIFITSLRWKDWNTDPLSANFQKMYESQIGGYNNRKTLALLGIEVLDVFQMNFSLSAGGTEASHSASSRQGSWRPLLWCISRGKVLQSPIFLAGCCCWCRLGVDPCSRASASSAKGCRWSGADPQTTCASRRKTKSLPSRRSPCCGCRRRRRAGGAGRRIRCASCGGDGDARTGDWVRP